MKAKLPARHSASGSHGSWNRNQWNERSTCLGERFSVRSARRWR